MAGCRRDAATEAALRVGVPGLSLLSPERVWSETKRILQAAEPGAAVALMAELGVLAAVFQGADPGGFLHLLACGAPAEPLLRLAALTSEDAEALAGRLRLAGDERVALALLRGQPAPHPRDDDAALRRLLAELPAKMAVGRAWLRQAQEVGGPSAAWDALRDRLAAMKRPVFPIAGRDALALGLAPGPAVGAALRTVRAWWLAGGCIADADACRAELARRVRA